MSSNEDNPAEALFLAPRSSDIDIFRYL